MIVTYRFLAIRTSGARTNECVWVRHASVPQVRLLDRTTTHRAVFTLMEFPPIPFGSRQTLKRLRTRGTLPYRALPLLLATVSLSGRHREA
jgi:hypothetical protein